ncbi:hypothetical protein [Flavobacterium sp.]
MKNIQEYKLIEGTFSIEEAEKILSMLFNYKIDYHNREDFSNHVRFNKNIQNSKKRISELIETKNSIKNQLADLKSNPVNLIINSTITISFET